MLDIRLLREDAETIKTALAKRGSEENMQLVDEALAVDKQRRTLLSTLEEQKAERNKVSKEIPTLKKEGKDVSPILEEMKTLGDSIKEGDDQLRELDQNLHHIMSSIPNRPNATVPEGTDDSDNVEVRRHLEPTSFNFEPKAHWDIGVDLDIIDAEMGAKVTGARFVFYKNAAARLERAVINFMLNTHADKHGYSELLPPFLANGNSMYGTGQLPKFAEDMYKVENNDYYLVPTAEVPVTNMHKGEILSEDELPIKHVAYSPCFRAEAGSAGRDTRGLIRLHQFNKVELVKFSKPEESYDELEALTGNAETILKELKLPYRVVNLCGGDLGFASAQTYDIEVWMPSYNDYVEISSCSNFEDFQARRTNTRYRDAEGKLQFVHTLNGSGLAAGRTVAAILENYQQEDGSVKIPEVLLPYFTIDTIR